MLRRAGQKGSVLFGAAAAQTRSTWLPSSVLSSSLPRRWLTSAEHASPPLSPDLPSEAKVVVVGGGVIGASVAYHLTHMGCKDVVLLERDQLTSGTTWHAAGLMVTFGSCSETSTEFRKYTRDLYSRLEAETGQSTGFMPVGFIELAEGKDRLIEFRRVAAINRKFGVDVRELSPAEVQSLWPLANLEGIEAGFFVEGDGRVNPVDCAMAMAKGAKMQGATIIPQTTVTGVTQAKGKVTGVNTARGHVKAEYVVNCAGMWARQFGELAGVTIANQAAEHYYLITEPIAEAHKKLPVLEDPSRYGYYREEGGGIMVGLFEPESAGWCLDGIPHDFSFGDIEPDWGRMAPFVEKAMSRVPITFEAGVKKFFCGPESFTPDLAPYFGEAPELRNYFVCAGLNSIGILTGGGIGRALAHWIVKGQPNVDITGINIDRCHPYQATRAYRAERALESLGKVYKLHYPSVQPKTARGVKRPPYYQQLKEKGAYFKDVSGWESPGWYAPNGVEPRIEKHSWGRENWFPYWEAEHKACREAVALIDMTFMGKFLVQGKDAGRMLNYISAGNVDGPEGKITYTQWLNPEGKMEADVTVIKFNEAKYMVVVTDTMHRHVETMLRRGIPDGAHVCVTDVTSGLAQLNLQGPRSRELLQALTPTDMSNAAFPFRHVAVIEIGMAKLHCVRVTYVGELGYELYIPAEMAVHVYETIIAKGDAYGLRHVGLSALGSLRLEKGYRDYGHDMDNTDTVLEVGLGFAVDFKKRGGFVGKDAVLAQKNEADGKLRKRLVSVLCKDPNPLMFHSEVLLRDGVAVGYMRIASYGHTLGGAVGLALVEAEEGEFVTKQWLDDGKWQVNLAGTLYPAAVSLKPFYDPSGDKIKC